MSALVTLSTLAARAYLVPLAMAPVQPADGLAPDMRTVVLLGPDEPAFWPHFTTQPEAADGAADPLDRWSRRVIGAIACDIGGTALFPFGGPPWRPFTRWALRSGRVWASPVGLLVHGDAGLFVSFRGAVALREAVTMPAAVSPCAGCAEQPCLSACPVGALSPQGYDVPACHAWLNSAAGHACLTLGCAVRRACPVGATRRLPAQSAFHMKAFHAR